jgi:CheY-like chemotaxis protein
MSVSFSSPAQGGVARVLLADAGLASRLVVKSILSAAGYCVSGVASGAEAIGKLDEDEYQLVLADLRSESDDAGPRLLAYAKQKEFRPATALLSSELRETGGLNELSRASDHRAVHISNEDLSDLIGRVADLIGRRADRKIRQSVLKPV